MHTAELSAITAAEVLVLDTSTFVEEIGLASKDGSALKHYLYLREMRLVVPEVVAEECERHLTNRARGKRKSVEESLAWLGRFCGKVSGWPGPSDETIATRANALARAEHLKAAVVPETGAVRRRAASRNQHEQPPSHKTPQPADCRIWEQCLALLARCHVVFVSGDGDFCGHREPDTLHPTLRAEAKRVAGDRILTFHRTMESLLAELRSTIRPIPNSVVFTFVYESSASVIKELESNSGCYPKGIGAIKQILLTTDQADVIEVRLEIADTWESVDKARTMEFRMSGSCRYRLAEKELYDLKTSTLRLLSEQPDGSIRSVKGSYVQIRAHGYFGAPPIQPKPAELVTN